MSWIWLVLVSFWNGFIIISDLLITNLLFLLLIGFSVIFVILELREDDTLVNDERKLV